MENEDTTGVRRSNRFGSVPSRLGTFIEHIHTAENAENTEDYNENTAQVIAYMMCHYESPNCRRISEKKFYQLVQTHISLKGIKKFGDKAKKAAYKEMR